jgi:hypothetical protein
MIAAQDPYVMKLKAEAKGAVMINIPGMTRNMAEKLLDLIDEESKLDSSMFAGKIISLGPYSEEDVTKGEGLFLGSTNLTNAGPSCVYCHSVDVVGSDLGGQLGPNLTQVFDRLQGRIALTAWLSAPPTPTMQSVFKDNQLSEDEIKYLVSYFESATSSDDYGYDSFIVWMTVIFCGLGGTVLVFVIFGGVWHNRFKAVRKPMVKRSKKIIIKY